MGYYAKKIGDVWCVAIDDGREDGHVWGCDDEQQAGDLAEIFNDELESVRSELAARRESWRIEKIAMFERLSSAERALAARDAEIERLRAEDHARHHWVEHEKAMMELETHFGSGGGPDENGNMPTAMERARRIIEAVKESDRG